MNFELRNELNFELRNELNFEFSSFLLPFSCSFFLLFMANRTSTVHTLEEWTAIVEHEVRAFAKALQSLKKQLQVSRITKAKKRRKKKKKKSKEKNRQIYLKFDSKND